MRGRKDAREAENHHAHEMKIPILPLMALLLAAVAAALHAQDEGRGAPTVDAQSLPVVPIAKVLEDRNGDTIPDLLLKPVHVRGVVTIGTGVITDDRLQVFIQDDTGGVHLFSRRSRPPRLEPGDILDVTGVVDQYRGGVQILNPRYQVVGHAPVPPPVKVSLKEAASWRYYGRLVEVKGTVGKPTTQGPNILIPLSGEGITTSLLLPSKVAREFPFASIPDRSRVSAAGVVSIYSVTPPYNDGFRLIVAWPPAVRVVSRPMPEWVRKAIVAILLAALVAVAVVLIRRAIRLRTKRRERHIGVLNVLASSLAGFASDIDSLLGGAVAILSRDRLIEGAIIHLNEGNALRMHRIFGISDEQARIVDERIQTCIAPTFPVAPEHGPIDAIVMRDVAPKFHPLLCVPLQGRSRMIGILTVFTALGHTPLPEEASTIAAAANLIALGIENIQVLRESEQRQFELKQLAITDPLTGLYNRRFLDEYLRIHIPMAKRQSAPVSFIALDLDHFKEVNDRYGHEAGDLLLAEVGHTIRRMTRAGDLPVRVGGEEFLVVMPDTNEAGAVVFAVRLQKEFREADLSAAGMPPDFRLTASFSIGIYPDHGENPRDLLRAVDEALYESKHAGRDCITVVPPPFRMTED